MTPPFAIAWYIDAICIAVTPMPWPIGIVPIEDAVQLAAGRHEARRFAGEAKPRVAAEAVPADPVHEERLADHLGDRVGSDVRRLLEDLRRVVRDGLAVHVVVDELVADLDLPRQVPEEHVRVDQPGRERRRERDDLVRRPRLVGRHQSVVLGRPGRREVGQRVHLVVVVAGRRRHGQDRSCPRVEHDPRRPGCARRLEGLGEHRLDLGLDGGVERQRDVATGDRTLELHGLERLPDRVVHDHLTAGRSLEHLVVLLLDPGEARALGAAGAGHLGVPEHLRPEPVERVPAGQLRDGRDAGQVLGHDPGGDLGLELAQHPAPAPAQLILDRLHVVRPRGVRPVLLLLVMLGVVALLELVEAEGAGDDHGGVVRVRELSLVRDDRLR